MKVSSPLEVPTHLFSTREASTSVADCIFASPALRWIPRNPESEVTAQLYRHMAILSPKLLILEDILRNPERFHALDYKNLTFEAEWRIVQEKADCLRLALRFRPVASKPSVPADSNEMVADNDASSNAVVVAVDEASSSSELVPDLLELWCPSCSCWIQVSLCVSLIE